MNGISPAILAASLAGTGLLAFGAGFLLGAPTSHAEARNRPIVDPHAWDVAATAPRPDPPRLQVAECNPWDVSDMAMEAVLDEMMQRGWRPPHDVEETLAAEQQVQSWRDEPAQIAGSEDVTGGGGAQIEIVSDKEAARLWNAAPEALAPPAQPASSVSSN